MSQPSPSHIWATTVRVTTLRRLALSVLFTITTNSYQTTCTISERTLNKRQHANARCSVGLLLFTHYDNHHHHNQVHQVEVSNPGQVTNSEILKSIQSITEVMQQQLLLNSKTTKQGIVQMASLFQEMIKAQEKRDLDPALLAIPTFSGEAKDRPQCLDWVSRVKNVCDQSGCSFHQELINKSGILVQNFIRSLNEKITNNELTEKILQFFSDVLMTSHALNKLQLI